MRNIVLLRVGIDSSSGGIQGPLFKDGTFDFVYIPDKLRVSSYTYGNLRGKNGRYLMDYFPKSWRTRMAGQQVHVDPEWDTFTYGDPTTPKRSLRTLKPGDFLVMYCGLQEWDCDYGFTNHHRPALYLAGFFEVALARMAADFNKTVLENQFGKNFHVRYPTVFEHAKAQVGSRKRRSG